MSINKIHAKSYAISIGENALKELNLFLSKHFYQSYFILCDENTLQYCLPLLVRSCPKLAVAEIIEVESGEGSKSLEINASIWQTLIENKADKKSLLINLGGGVISDLGGFTASVYKRGIDFLNIPTSLLAMADASVGGKTGINFLTLKNVLGTFSEPKAVFIYPPFLSTLPERHLQNGIIEIYKIALVSDKKLWKLLTNDKTSLDDLITKGIALKNKIVNKDPKDNGHRKILNFGHTIGHALESVFIQTDDELLHGEAVLIGMLMESHLAFQKKLISKQILNSVTNTFRDSFFFPVLDDSAFTEMMSHMTNDKKNKNGTLLFALICGIGESMYDIAIKPSQIKKAFEFYNSLNK